eukprot:3351844-Karenia_brevis.AAC.1
MLLGCCLSLYPPKKLSTSFIGQPAPEIGQNVSDMFSDMLLQPVSTGARDVCPPPPPQHVQR